MKRLLMLVVVVLLIGAFFWFRRGPVIRDDAMLLGLTPSDFPELSADVFGGMDQGTALSPEAIRGRNTWNLWTGGSQVFLDWLAREGYGVSDILKLIDSRSRGTRFERLGLFNEPGFQRPEAPDRFGLWLDVPAGGAELGRIDRMIQQLRGARKLERAAGVAVGDFSNCVDERWPEQTAESVIEEAVRPLGLPLATGLPFGHVRANAPWPVGARATIDGVSGELRILERGVGKAA
jgi:hypothetical protein